MNIKTDIKSIVCLVLFSIVITASTAAETMNNSRNWSSGTAFILPQKRYEIGLFQALRYGYSESVELSIHPIIALVMPNISLKKSLATRTDFIISSRHAIYYPTPLLRLITKEGIGGMISPEFEIPHIISLYNEIILTKPLADFHYFTIKTGLNLAVKSSRLDERTTIDLPLIFPRLAVFYRGIGLRGGCDLTGKIFQNWEYLVDADIFYYFNTDENFALEHKGMILWNTSENFQISMGYKLTFCEYPFGNQWHFFPLMDIQWSRQLKTK